MAVHYPVPEWSGLITSIAYPYSPAEIAARRDLPLQHEPRGGAGLAARDVQDRVRNRRDEALAARKLIRSKNSGPFELTFDVILKDRATYEKVRDANIINARVVRAHLPPQAGGRAIINYDAAAAIKITIPRPTVSGDIDDNDVFGGQQYGPLCGSGDPVRQ